MAKAKKAKPPSVASKSSSLGGGSALTYAMGGAALIAAILLGAFVDPAQLLGSVPPKPPAARQRMDESTSGDEAPEPPLSTEGSSAYASAASEAPVRTSKPTTVEASKPTTVAEARAAAASMSDPAAFESEPPRPPPRPGCKDSKKECEGWGASGECENNPSYMKEACPDSCGICDGTNKPKVRSKCEDQNVNCNTWAFIGECESNPAFMKAHCPLTCRLCQSEKCNDKYPDCAERARGPAASNFSDTTGCYTDPDLREKCAWTCLACSVKKEPRCKRDRSIGPAGSPGSVNRMFEQIAKEPTATVWSSDPWVITLDNFLSERETQVLLEAGSKGGTGWARSQAGDGVQEARTSSTSWCRGPCLDNKDVQAVQQRVERITGVPIVNAEFMQLLEYKKGQFYKVHHDQNSPRSSAWGPRMYTFFLYLAEGYTGGETHFPRLNVTIPAKRGSALIWPSVLDGDPNERDDRTDHEALPVISGIKYAANYWIHMYPFRGKSDFCDNQAYDGNWY